MENIMFYLLVTALFTWTQLSESSTLLDESFNLCTSVSTCDSCIGRSYTCSWCGAPGYEYHRCNLNTNHISHGCPTQYLYNPPSTFDSPAATDPGIQVDGKTINISPQLVNLKLRPGDTYKFNVTVYVSLNYPVDLYYLVDNTFSMKDDFSNLAYLSNQLIQEMVAITKNFYLGLGTFNDKPMKPWIFTNFYTGEPIALCDDCAIPDVFKHQLSLTNISHDEFAVKLKDVKFAATIEDTEATLEAMLQVVACPNIIGWRDNAKRILLVSTESIAHFAGDGIFSGLYRKHSGECYTDKNGVYSAWDKYDFPTAETLYYKLKESRVQTVFAIPEQRKLYYEELVKVLPMSFVAVMAEDSKDVVKVVVDSFTKIAKLVQLTFVDMPDNDVLVNFTAFCPNGEVKVGSKVCEDVEFDSNVTFEISVTAPLVKSFSTSFSIAQESLEHWSELKVNVDSVSQTGCKCDDVSLYPPDNEGDTCSNSGYRICGGCVCNSGYSGDICQCSASDPVNISSCLSPKMGISLPCSDRGTCFCDGCKCVMPPVTSEILHSLHGSAPRVFGQFCQCDNWSCRKHAGLVCGGVDRGVCEICDTNGPSCKCKPEFTGKACECPKSIDTCVAKSSGLVCNGEGECICGQCRCYASSRYRGDTCEQCFNCPNKHCAPNEDCVICAHKHRDEFLRNNDTTVCYEQCKNVDVIITDEPSEADGREQCIAEDDDDCSYVFYYFPPSNETDLPTLEICKKYCDDDLALYLIIIAIIIGILLLGVSALVAWKIIVTIQDRREFAEFQAALKDADVKRNENPMFRMPVQTFKNPSHQKEGAAKRRSMRFR